MIVHLFHESLLHFIKILWSMVIFVRICEIFGMSNKYLFSPDTIGVLCTMHVTMYTMT